MQIDVVDVGIDLVVFVNVDVNMDIFNNNVFAIAK